MQQMDFIKSQVPNIDVRLGEPRIWIQQLVILETLDTQKPIRDIPFQLGFNIVAAEVAGEEDDGPVGHDVGKTLLVRLIRYCMGDDHFADEEQSLSIGGIYPNGYVLARFRVEQKSWCVARPIGVGASWCMRSDDLEEVRSQKESESYSVFLDTLEKTTCSCFADICLPGAENRTANWRDLLGWVARDQDCLYHHWGEWRTTESQSGPRSLNRTDAYLIMRMALGLINPKERAAIKDKAAVVKKLSTNTKAREDTEVLVVDYEKRVLTQARSLKLSLDDGLCGPLLAQRVEKEASETVSKLDDLDASEGERKELELKNNERDQLNQRIGALKSSKEDIDKRISVENSIIEHMEAEESDSMDSAQLGLAFSCKYYDDNPTRAEEDGCPVPNKYLSDPVQRGNWRLEQLEDVRKKRDDLLETADALASSLADSRNTLLTIDAKIKDLNEAKEKKAEALAELIHKWNELGRTAKSLREENEKLSKIGLDQRKLEDDEKDAVKRIASFRKEGAEASRSALSQCYEAIVRQMLSADARAEIKVDGNGVRPVISNVSSSGTTLKSCVQVHGFDLACLHASMCGIGNLPRFWIHDSPRAADTEDKLYHKIMKIVADMEKLCGDSALTFQHIWTTTTPPPNDLDNDTYVRERLHARDVMGKLLRRNF